VYHCHLKLKIVSMIFCCHRIVVTSSKWNASPREGPGPQAYVHIYLLVKAVERRKKTYDEYLGAGFLALPSDPLKGLPNRLRRSEGFPISILFCRLPDRGVAVSSNDVLARRGEGTGDMPPSFEDVLLLVGSNLTDDPDSVECSNVRRRLFVEYAVSF
jgi:hypothetical protein